MRPKTAVILGLTLVFAVDVFSAPPPASVIKTDIVTISLEQQYDVVQPGSNSALAVHFELKKDWHFYASAESAQGDMNLKIKVEPVKDQTLLVDGKEIPFSTLQFDEPVLPKPEIYFDKSSNKKLEVFSNTFTVYIPFRVRNIYTESGYSSFVREGSAIGYPPAKIRINVEGAVCSDIQCRMPDFGDLSTVIEIADDAPMGEPKFALPERTETTPRDEPVLTGRWAGYSAWFALSLALLAGLSLNIMPCIWPVLPLIVMRIVEQAKRSKGSSIAMGLAFCFGILLFFTCLAVANIILQFVYGTVLQWGDQFRNPAFVAGMALLLVVLALFMFGVFNITVPSAIAGKSSSGRSLAGSIGMGFLAAILSTPCSFGILAAVFAWAQAQHWLLATLVIMTIGLGMALPYLILTSMPQLLKRLPKSGRWMELFKQAIGFVLLVIAVWLIAALPQSRRMDVLYFAVVLSFCVWMWGGWVSYGAKPLRKWLIRTIAIVLVVTAGWEFLSEPTGELIDWQNYDTDLVETALAAKKPVLIKFTADWCLSCKAIDKIVYSRKDIAKLIEEKDVLAVKADTTTKDLQATIDLKDVYNEPGVPVSTLFLPDKKDPIRWRDKFFADELKRLLEKLPSK